MTLKLFLSIRNIFFLIFTLPVVSYAQFGPQKVEQIGFSNRVNNPLKIEVMKNRGQYEFYVTNDSYYPCLLEINFQRMQNLTPPKTQHRDVVGHGRTRLFTLAPHMADQSVDYSYSYKYTLGDPDAKPDPAHPYLIPVSKGSKVSSNQNSSVMVKNIFSTSEGDTVFAMRKGTVTAMPDNAIPVDRFSASSLEILHSDGTVAMYQNLDPKSVFVNLGEKIFPGMPLGLVLDANPLAVNVFSVMASPTGTTIRSFNYRYALDDTATVASNYLREGVIVNHPQSVIEKEMTKAEVKRAKKRK